MNIHNGSHSLAPEIIKQQEVIENTAEEAVTNTAEEAVTNDDEEDIQNAALAEYQADFDLSEIGSAHLKNIREMLAAGDKEKYEQALIDYETDLEMFVE